MKTGFRAFFAASLLAGIGVLCGACGHDETVVRRETYTYMPQPTPAPRVPVTSEKTVVEKTYRAD